MVLKGERQGLEKKFFDLCHEVVAEQNLQLYDVEYLPGQGLLRVFIMDPQTQSALLDDCVRIDHALTPHLEESWVPGTLTLEVSSPGMYRHLGSIAHFEAAKGQEIALTTLQGWAEGLGLSKQLTSQHRLKGVLVAVGRESIELEVSGQNLSIGYDKIKNAKLDPQWQHG